MSASLKISNVSKVFDKNVALNNVSLDIQAGEFVCLLGPSGCGKSTLLRLIAGLDHPSSGRIFIGERDVTNLPPSRRNFGIMFQSYALFPNLTAFENVAYGLRNKKIRTKDIEERVNRLFDMIKLSHAKNRLPSQMSGGEQQRVSIARALCKNPALLLCDEPTGALDSKTGEQVLELLSRVSKTYHTTVVIITHNASIAPLGDRVIRMRNGTIVENTVNPHPARVEDIAW